MRFRHVSSERCDVFAAHRTGLYLKDDLGVLGFSGKEERDAINATVGAFRVIHDCSIVCKREDGPLLKLLSQAIVLLSGQSASRLDVMRNAALRDAAKNLRAEGLFQSLQHQRN